MEMICADELSVYYDAGDGDAAELVARAVTESAQLIRELWSVDEPRDCRVYVMTSWRRFLLHAAPWQLKPVVVVLLPLYASRARKVWQFAGGWHVSLGKRRAVGVKPPRLLAEADRSVGDRIYVRGQDLDQQVRQATCHELVHAFTDHLALPTWLHEGLAMVTVDHLAGRETVRRDSLAVIERLSREQDAGGRIATPTEGSDELLYLVIRGYWLTRYVEETQPDLLAGLLNRRQEHTALESQLAGAYGMTRDMFWQRIDGMILDRFGTD